MMVSESYAFRSSDQVADVSRALGVSRTMRESSEIFNVQTGHRERSFQVRMNSFYGRRRADSCLQFVVCACDSKLAQAQNAINKTHISTVAAQ